MITILKFCLAILIAILVVTVGIKEKNVTSEMLLQIAILSMLMLIYMGASK